MTSIRNVNLNVGFYLSLTCSVINIAVILKWYFVLLIVTVGQIQNRCFILVVVKNKVSNISHIETWYKSSGLNADTVTLCHYLWSQTQKQESVENKWLRGIKRSVHQPVLLITRSWLTSEKHSPVLPGVDVQKPRVPSETPQPQFAC